MNFLLFFVAAPLTLLALALARRGSPTGVGTPTRNLTLAQAVSILHAYQNEGVISGLDTSRTLAAGMNDTVAGVRYLYLGKVFPNILRALDPRLAVLLVRLALFAKARYGATGIDTIGIFNPDRAPDVHAFGRAADISGIVTPSKTWSVLRDWGQKPKDGFEGFRLPSTDPGYAVFRDLYAFLASQASDRQTAPGQKMGPTAIGDHGFVVSPDHPDPVIAPAHQDHLHVQIGPTKGPDPAAALPA